MPLMSTSNPEAAVARWILRAAEWSDAVPPRRAPSPATSTFWTNAPASPRFILRAERDSSALTNAPNGASDSDSDSGASDDEDDNGGSATAASIPPFPPVRELHPSLRNIIPPFPPLGELHPSLRGLRMGAAGAPTLVRATWAHEHEGPAARAPVFSKPPRDADASGARALVIEAGGGDDVTDTDGSAQYSSEIDSSEVDSSEGEDYIADWNEIENTPGQDALHYAPEPEDDEQSHDVIVKDEDEDGWDGVDDSEVHRWAAKYYDSDDSDVQSQGTAGDDESDGDGDDEDGTLAKRYCSDDDLLPPPQKRRKLGHTPAAHAAVSQRVPIARTRGRALRRTGSANSMALRYILN